VTTTDSTVSKSRKKQALRYAGRGWLVVPMHTIKHGICSCKAAAACNRPGKHPRTVHGVNDATTDVEQVKAWWKKWPHANIGIAAGEKSGIVVLDIDSRHGGVATLDRCETELGPLPKTVTALTGGGGRHLFFKYPDFPVRKDTGGKFFGSGVDVLSGGSIVIVPPSRHASGKRYAWEEGKSITEIVFADLPAPWLSRLRNDSQKAQASAAGSSKIDSVIEGQRNNHLASLAGAMQRTGASAESILAALNHENSTKCSPPLDDAEVQGIVASISRYQPTALSDVTDSAEKVMHLVLDRHFGGGKHLLLGPEGRFWLYDIRLWRPIPDKWVSGRVLQIIQANPMAGQNSASLINQTLTLLKAKLATKDDVLSYTAEPPPVINCANGEVWIADDGSVELRPHRPESYLRDALDVTYDPAATCPQYDRAVLEIFSKANKPKRMVRHWNELMGYVLQPRRNIPIIVILLGGGDNGKTVLINTVVRLLGHQLVQAKSVDSLDKSQFAIGSLFGKRLFLDDDVKAGARLPDGMLKTMSEAKIVTGEKKHQDDFNFVVRSVPVLLCNNIPSLADLPKGMIRRLMVIPFDRTFTDEEKDPDLFQRIWSHELSGILNQGLAGYKRVVERNFRFKRPSPVTSATNRWLQQANPLPAFIHDRCIKKANGKVLVRDFYAAYTQWTKEMGYTLTQTQIVMTRNLAHRGYGTKRTNSGVAIIGLELREVE
jgi:putative DNA primase/helicase